MQPNDSDSFVVTMTTLVYGGHAMGRLPDGRAVFVPYCLPGETVRVRLLEEKRGHAKAELIEILETSPDRIPPRCTPAAACGGLHYQHIAYPRQLEFKREIVRDQLERIGRQSNVNVEPVVPSPKTWHYRNNVQFHVTPDGKLGFVEPGTNQVVPAVDCPLAEEPLNVIWPQLELEPGTGIERISLRLGADEDILLLLEGLEVNPPEFSIEDLPVSAVYSGPAGPILLAGSDYLILEALNRQFKVSAGSFFQVNIPQAEAMLQFVLDQVQLGGDEEVLELYSGVGLFSAFLAPRARHLVAIESTPSSTDDFVYNLDEFDNVELYEAPVEHALQGLNLLPEIVLADPPRAGLGRKVVEQLLKINAPRIVYVSCDPATLARDIRQLVEAGYHLEKVNPFDMFPHTYHIETIVLLSKI
jgi:23S rRNA (uracil1939-C5)-methyltransferase